MVVCASLAATLALRYLLGPVLGDRAPYEMLLVAVMVSAWIGGYRAGMCATFIGTALATWLFIPSLREYGTITSGQCVVLSLMLLQGVLISLSCRVIHQVVDNWRVARKQAALDFENMANHAPGFVWSTKADGAPGFVNQAWLTFTGQDEHNIEMDRLKRAHVDDIPQVRAAMSHARASKTSYHVEYRLRRADGVYRWILEHAVPRTGRGGEFEGFIGAGTDITPSHQEREELLFIGELHRVLASSLDLDKTAEAVTRSIVPAVADWCCIQILEEGSGRLDTPRVHHSHADVRQRHAEFEDEPADLENLGERSIYRVLRDGEAQLISLVDDAFLRGLATSEAHLGFLRGLGFVSYLGVPLRVRGKIVGLLSLATAESRRTLGNDTLQLAIKIAGIAAFALENARLHQSMCLALEAEGRARREMEQSERRFRCAWEANVFGIGVISRSGEVRSANDAFLSLYGYDRADMEAGRVRPSSRIGDREVSFGDFIWEHLASSAAGETFENICLNPDGRAVPVLVVGSALPEGDDCLVFILDLTARRAAETALDRHRSLLKTIIDAVPAMVAYIDGDERFVLHNRQYERWMGIGYDDIHGKTVRELLGDERYPEAQPHLQAALAGNNVRYEKVIHGPEKWRDAMVTYRPDIGADGRVEGVVVHAYDITESRQLAVAVARSEKRYRTLITASADIVWTADPQGRIQEATGWETFTGRSLDEGGASTWMQLIHDEDRARVEQRWRVACETGEKFGCAYRLRAADGTYHHVHVRGAPIHDHDGKVEEWIGTVDDITLRVEFEQSLRRKESELKLVVNTMPALVSYVDSAQRYVLANQAYHKWFGLDPDTIRGKTVLEVIGADAHRELSGQLTRVMAGEVLRFEEYVPHPHHAPRWISCTLTPHVGDDGRVQGFFALVLDITERKESERTMADLLERYRFLADAMPQNVWTANAAGEQDYVNRRWVEYTGIDPFEAGTDRWPEIVHPDDVAGTVKRWHHALATGESYEMEHRLRDAEGRYHWFLSLAQGRRDKTGRVVQWVGTATNIDGHRRAYADLAEARSELKRHADNLEHVVRLRTARLEEVNSELEAFTYSASHDLRVPLHHIHGFAEAILEDRDTRMSASSQTNMRLIVGAAKRMDTLVIDLLAYSRMSRGEVELEVIDLGSVVSDVLAEFRATIKSCTAEVQVEQALPSVRADRTGVQQVVTNLIANALKFVSSERRPRLSIHADTTDGGVRLWVEDNGIGIDPRQHEAIFKIFHRLHSHRDYDGTGVGLSLVKKGMVRMGGSCGVESKPGVGSRFWLQFQPAHELVGYNG